MRPAAHLLFLRAQEKKAKEVRPTSATPALRSGANLRRASDGVGRRTHCALAALRSDSCGQPEHEAAASFGAAATPPDARRRRSLKGVEQPHGPSLRSAPNARARSAALTQAERSDGPRGLAPCARAEERRAWGGQWQRSMPLLRALAHCGCLSEALQARSEFRSAAPGSSTAGCPVAQRRGHAQWGRFLCLLSCACKKVGRPPGRNPGLPPQSSTKNIKKDSCPRKPHKR